MPLGPEDIAREQIDRMLASAGWAVGACFLCLDHAGSTVRRRSLFEEMKGRGVRVINDEDLKAVTPDAKAKDHFIIVDVVGVCERNIEVSNVA